MTPGSWPEGRGFESYPATRGTPWHAIPPCTKPPISHQLYGQYARVCVAMRSVDVHQHLWPEAVLRVLERRSAPPKARWQDGRWRIELHGGAQLRCRPARSRSRERARGLAVDRALVALSSPVGLEALPARDALAAIAAWQEAATALPPELGWWAATPEALQGEGEAELAREAIAAGAAGVCLPANRLATPRQANEALPLLNAVADAGAPVFVHPGPATTGSPARATPGGPPPPTTSPSSTPPGTPSTTRFAPSSRP